VIMSRYEFWWTGKTVNKC